MTNTSYSDALEEVLAQGQIPRLYLDTNVILDILQPRRRPQSVDLFNEGRSRKWELVSSTFALLEAVDVEQWNTWIMQRIREGQSPDRVLRSRGERDLSRRDLRSIERRWERFITQYEDVLEWVYLDEDGWQEALSIAVTTNILASDCIHVAAARITACDVLVTSDQALQRMAEPLIATALPSQLLAFVQAKG